MLQHSVRYNSTQRCSCCLLTWMQPFSQAITIPPARSERPQPHPMTGESSSVCYAYNQNKFPCFIYIAFI